MSTIKAATLSDLSDNTVPVNTVVNGVAKAWVSFNGTGTVAIRDSFNVSSITDAGVGNYTVNFAIPRSNTNYAAVVTANRTGTWADGKQNVSTKTVNSVLVQHVEGAAFVLSEYFAKGEKL